ncbi:M20/M25/M40 family metallo-hydrolase [Actinomadura algeriensis]|uniref:Acetylornithine deacetylase/succinyl-diaminopimelate desuccinylase-like protein n=1 Tax=Actinomadura algeriensis TaxID=1679523 RepID=A0ABR9JQH9_9ACTN|nr:M20/M25/M40 family metallo-hydrolase [Actinomadura algeriensis]MBE1532820.1 acetylornithine deacetylase/succinyl-diaminopimelate desuccinylase-like protein [Actinomadura algeriensis]
MPSPLVGDDRDLLVRLLRLPTAGPLESGPGDPPHRLCEAQVAYAEHAAAFGMRVVHHAPAMRADVERGPVPAVVRERLDRPEFLADQPSLVLRLGPAGVPGTRTVMFNVHLDTVGGVQPVSFDGVRFTGRGAIDAKGPAVALLAGIRAARARRPAIGRDVGVLVQAVAGEEGGAMGVFGTRPLVQAGLTGRLNVFCEPTRGRFLTRCTASMTARVVVEGADAIDDRPGEGHNASVLLGWLAQWLGHALDPYAAHAAVCVAGLHTGSLHNKVYGAGALSLNLAYSSMDAGRRMEREVEAALLGGLDAFADRFGDTMLFARTAADAHAITRLEWEKRGLPVLDDRHTWGHALLRDAGIPAWPPDEPAFTCDAIWMSQIPGACTVVLGPGDLAANNAHADGEFADAEELAAFADAVTRLLIAFTDESAP